MNFLSLFSGIGGLDLGLERAGMTVVGQVEIDPWCRKVLAKHWPEVPRHDDVRTAAGWWGDPLADAAWLRDGRPRKRTVDGGAGSGRAERFGTDRAPDGPSTAAAGRPRVDLVCGGFPCQPVSVAGLGLAQADERWLWPSFAGIVRDLRPRYVLVENVPGLLGRGMGDVLGDLAAIGYDAEWDCISAADVGANHLRKRIWIIAHAQREQLRDEPGRRNGQDRPRAAVSGDDGTAQPMADTEGQCGELRQATGERPGRSAGGGPGVAKSESFGRTPNDPGRAAHWPTPHGTWSPEPDVGRVASRLSTGMDGDLNAHAECITQGRTAGIPQTERLRELRNHIAATETPSRPERCALCGHPLSAMPCRGACPPWYLGHRPEDSENLRCLREGLLGLLAHTREDLLARLPVGTGTAERAQTVGSRVDRLRGLGNAVVPQVAEHIGRLIMNADGQVRT